jgi:EAL domain-containing protein (putative c-di-GMP-specific phosphodiesterase class I)
MDAVLKLPFSSIKIDRSLLNGITEDEKAFLFYQNIVAALKSMGYIIISEGAEHQEEVDILLDWDVNMIQGYYFSRPLNQEDLLDLLCLQVA